MKWLSNHWKPQKWTLSSLEIKVSIFTLFLFCFVQGTLKQTFRALCIFHSFVWVIFYLFIYFLRIVYWQSFPIDCFVFHPCNLSSACKSYSSLSLVRPHAVKPLSTTDKQPDLRETQDNSRSATITDHMQVKMKVVQAFFFFFLLIYYCATIYHALNTNKITLILLLLLDF